MGLLNTLQSDNETTEGVETAPPPPASSSSPSTVAPSGHNFAPSGHSWQQLATAAGTVPTTAFSAAGATAGAGLDQASSRQVNFNILDCKNLYKTSWNNNTCNNKLSSQLAIISLPGVQGDKFIPKPRHAFVNKHSLHLFIAIF